MLQQLGREIDGISSKIMLRILFVHNNFVALHECAHPVDPEVQSLLLLST